MASIDGVMNNAIVVNTLDGLTTITTSGGTIDPALYVKYKNNTSDTDLGSYNIKTTHVPTLGADLVNLQALTDSNTYILNLVGTNFLNKVNNTTPQTVAGTITFNGPTDFTQNTRFNDTTMLTSDGTQGWETTVAGTSGGGPFDMTYHNIQTSVDIKFKDTGKIEAKGFIDTDATASRVAIYDASKELTSSSTTSTELGYLSGVTSAIQTQLNTKATTTYVDTQDASLQTQINTKASTTYVDTQDALKVSKNGDTITGAINWSGTPSASTNLTTKAYVDSAVAGISPTALLASNNTWTGTNQYNNNITVSGDTHGLILAGTSTQKIYVTSTDAYNPTGQNNLMIKSWYGIGFPTYDDTVHIAMDTRLGDAYFEGALGIGATTISSPLKLKTYGTGATGWKGMSYFGNGAVGVVAGTYDNVAYLGAHTADLSHWADIAIAMGGNVGIGLTNPSSKLTVYGDTATTGLFKIIDVITLGNDGVYYDSLNFLRTSSGTFPNIKANDNYIGMYVTDAGGWVNGSQVGEIVFRTNNHNIRFTTNNGTSSTLIIGNGGLTTNNLYASGTVSPGMFGRQADLRAGIKPSDVNANSFRVDFGTYTNNNSGNFADCITLNTWTDSSGGATNMLAINKGSAGIRQYRGTYGSTTAMTTYASCVMTDDNSSNVSLSGNLTVYGNNNGLILAGNSTQKIYVTSTDAYNPTGQNNLMIKSWWGIGFPSYDDVVRIALDTRSGGAYFGGHVGIGATSPITMFEIEDPAWNQQTITRTVAHDDYGVGIQYCLKDITNNFRGYYVRTLGGSDGTIASSYQNQCNGYYVIDLAKTGNFGSDTSPYSSSYVFRNNQMTCSGSITIGNKGGGVYEPGCIYTDPSWGMLFRAKTASPGQAHFSWYDNPGNQLMILTDSGHLTTQNHLTVSSAQTWDTSITITNTSNSATWYNVVGGSGNGSTGVGNGNYGLYSLVGETGYKMVCDGKHTLFGKPTGGVAGPARLGVCGGNTGATYLNPSTWAADANAVMVYNDTVPGVNSTALMLAHNGSGYITSLTPGITWNNLYISGAGVFMYYFGTYSCGLTSSGWSPASDEREKEDIKDLKTSSSLARILALKPKHYKRKYYDKEDGTPTPEEVKQLRHVGFIAQEVKESNPHCLSTWENESIEKTEEDDGTRYAVSYNDFIVHLCGAVQEQQKMIETLTERSLILEDHARTVEEAFSAYRAMTDAKIEKLASLVASMMKS